MPSTVKLFGLVLFQVGVMELETEFEALGAVMSRGFRIASGQDAIDKVGHFVVEGISPASLEAFLSLLENAGVHELGDIIFARHVVDTQSAFRADDLGFNMAAGVGSAYLDVGSGLIVKFRQRESVVVIAVVR